MDKLFEILFPKLKGAIEKFLMQIGQSKLVPYIEFFYWLVALIILWIFSLIVKKLSRFLSDYRIKRNCSELQDYYSKGEVKVATSNYITTYGQQNDPADFLEPRESLSKQIGKQNLITFFISEFAETSHKKSFYLILGDSGMGKTTFLINLFVKYKLKFLVFSKRDIYLIPLSDNNYKSRINELKAKSKDAILLLDAFDEDITSWENPEESLKKLLKDVNQFSTVVLTSRGHFFSSKIHSVSTINLFSKIANKEEFKLKKIYLSAISDRTIYLYLVRKYIFSSPRKIVKAFKLVKQCPNLVVRPMLLNNVDFLLKTKSRYTFTAEIYSSLIMSWINREKQFIDEVSVIAFSKDIAINMYVKRNERKGLYISEKELEEYLKGSHVSKDTVLMKTRSLLNRTFDKYKFSHKSIFEYFLARSKFDDTDIDTLHKADLNNPFSLEGLSDAERFYREFFVLKITIPYLAKYANKSLTPAAILNTKTLNLERSKITTLLFLKEVDWLQALNLNNTLIRDLKPLYNLKNLKTLNLKGTYYDSSQVYEGEPKKELIELAEALPELKIYN